MRRCPDRSAICFLKDRQAAAEKGKADILTGFQRHVGGQACLDLTMGSFDCDDLRRAKILRPEDFSAETGVVAEGNMLRSGAEDEFTVRAGVCHFRHLYARAVQLNCLGPPPDTARKGNQVHGRRPYEISNE